MKFKIQDKRFTGTGKYIAMIDFAVLMGILAGVILFLYGIDGFSREIRTVAGSDLRRLLQRWTKNPFYGMVLGAIVTVFIQSSTATSVLTLSLVNSAIISFRQSISILLGTNIGTTLTAFLVAFKLMDIGPWFIVLGFVLSSLRIKYSFLGKAFFYFGLVFFALSQLSEVTAPLKDNVEFMDFLSRLESPLLAIGAGILVTMVIQSSSVVTGFLVILVQSGALTIESSIPIILGTNIGTTFTALLAARSMQTFAKRSAIVNTLIKFAGVAMFLPFLGEFTSFIASLNVSAGEQTAYAHLLFNIISSFVFLLIIPQLVWIGEKIIRDNDQELIFETKYLLKDSSDDFNHNFSALEQEIIHYLLMTKQHLLSVTTYVDLKVKAEHDRSEKYTQLSDFLSSQYEEYLYKISAEDKNKQHLGELVRFLRIVDYIKQMNVSLSQITGIPELLRLPNTQRLTVLKAEIFSFSTLFSQVIDEISQFLEKKDPKHLEKIDTLNAKIAALLTENYENLITQHQGDGDHFDAFVLRYLTRVQSVKAKLREIRKLIQRLESHEVAP